MTIKSSAIDNHVAVGASARFSVLDDDGVTEMSHGTVGVVESRYCDGYVRAMTVGGLGTSPEYRRRGCVRQIFEQAFDIAEKSEAVVSLLHPFSFSYYRKFGYEKLCDHRIIEFPMLALESFPRYAELVPYKSEAQSRELAEIFESFSRGRNIMFRRNGDAIWSRLLNQSDRSTYIYHDKLGVPSGYITLSVENHFYVNHMESDNLHVYELAFTNREALTALIGFMRMFEGQLYSVKLHNCAMMPEVDMLLRRYTHTKYTDVPDIAGRVTDTAAMLSANKYPVEAGSFRLRVTDFLPSVEGVFEVEYENEKAQVRRVSGEYDICIDAASLTRVMYGCDAFTLNNAVFLDSFEIARERGARDFLRAFPKRYSGLFEHF